MTRKYIPTSQLSPAQAQKRRERGNAQKRRKYIPAQELTPEELEARRAKRREIDRASYARAKLDPQRLAKLRAREREKHRRAYTKDPEGMRAKSRRSSALYLSRQRALSPKSSAATAFSDMLWAQLWVLVPRSDAREDIVSEAYLALLSGDTKEPSDAIRLAKRRHYGRRFASLDEVPEWGLSLHETISADVFHV